MVNQHETDDFLSGAEFPSSQWIIYWIVHLVYLVIQTGNLQVLKSQSSWISVPNLFDSIPQIVFRSLCCSSSTTSQLPLSLNLHECPYHGFVSALAPSTPGSQSQPVWYRVTGQQVSPLLVAFQCLPDTLRLQSKISNTSYWARSIWFIYLTSNILRHFLIFFSLLPSQIGLNNQVFERATVLCDLGPVYKFFPLHMPSPPPYPLLTMP